MKSLFILMVQIAFAKPLSYRKEGKFMIGAILPMTEDINGNDNCSKINPLGVTLADALVYALDEINREHDFRQFLNKTKDLFGYDIRDNCGNTQRTKSIATAILSESLNAKETKKTPIQVVISEFTNEDRPTLGILNGADIIQLSYSSDNARLRGTGQNIKNLVSVYPESTKKLLVAAAIIKFFQFKYVYGIASDDAQGKKSMSLLSSKLESQNICMKELLVTDFSGKIKEVVDKMAANKKVRVAVINCPKDVELQLYREINSRNMTNLIFISTQNWLTDMKKKLNPYMAAVDGMLDVNYKEVPTTFKTTFANKLLPYTGRGWLRSLFLAVGGEKSCLTNTGFADDKCIPFNDKVKSSLSKDAPVAEHLYRAVLAVAFALKKAGFDGAKEGGLVKTLAGLKIELPSLEGDPLVFSSQLSAERTKYRVENIRMDATKSSLETKYVAQWNEKTEVGESLVFLKKRMLWKNGSIETPVSACSDSCPPGFERSFLDGSGTKCCWKCSRCPNGTASNISNADQCHSCPEGTVVRPEQTGCKKYKLLYFHWFSPIGVLTMVLMVVATVLILFGLGIFSQNSSHELVVNSNYNSLALFLLACLVLVFAPIPLLIKPPTGTSCFTYILMFNIATAIIIGILTSRSAAVNALFDDNGELSRGTLGRFPRTLVVFLVVVLQIIITAVAYNMEKNLTMHNHTHKWDEKYYECASWASVTFWAGFSFNIVASVVGNSLSCPSVKMEDNCYELKYVLISHLMFYMFGVVELVIFFRSNDEHLAGGQAINCILFALVFFFSYAWPKIYAILFRSKGNKLIRVSSEDGDEDGSVQMHTAIHASAGFKHQGIVQMKVREEDD